MLPPPIPPPPTGHGGSGSSAGHRRRWIVGVAVLVLFCTAVAVGAWSLGRQSATQPGNNTASPVASVEDSADSSSVAIVVGPPIQLSTTEPATTAPPATDPPTEPPTCEAELTAAYEQQAATTVEAARQLALQYVNLALAHLPPDSTDPRVKLAINRHHDTLEQIGQPFVPPWSLACQSRRGRNGALACWNVLTNFTLPMVVKDLRDVPLQIESNPTAFTIGDPKLDQSAVISHDDLAANEAIAPFNLIGTTYAACLIEANKP